MTADRRLRLALVQPRSHSGETEHRNLDSSLRWLGLCAQARADLVVFPEGYPGPTNPRNSYDALTPLRAQAADLGLHVVAGGIEPASGDSYHVVLYLIDDQGKVLGSYRRSHPLRAHIYRDLDVWGFEYAGAAEPPRVFETRFGRIGMLVCSEVYVPELSRSLALQGADLIVYPAGGGQGEIIPNWRTVLQARAIENMVYTAANQNLYQPRERGLGMIAGPEGVLASRADEGLLIADLDLGRLDSLRRDDQRIEIPRAYLTVPGLLRWRRPEMYTDLSDPS